MDMIIVWCLIACSGALWVWNWSLFRILERHERQLKELQRLAQFKRQLEEDRCHFCAEQSDCPAFDTGVCYPCPYFKKEEG